MVFWIWLMIITQRILIRGHKSGTIYSDQNTKVNSAILKKQWLLKSPEEHFHDPNHVWATHTHSCLNTDKNVWPHLSFFKKHRYWCVTGPPASRIGYLPGLFSHHEIAWCFSKSLLSRKDTMPDFFFFLHKVPPNIYDKDNCHVIQTEKKKKKSRKATQNDPASKTVQQRSQRPFLYNTCKETLTKILAEWIWIQQCIKMKNLT